MCLATREMVQLAEQDQVLATSQNLINRSILTDQSDALTHLLWLCHNIEPSHTCLTSVEFKQRGENFHRCGFARTVGAEQPTNGAGKTTAVKILSTLLELDAGQACVAGFDVMTQPQQVRERIGLVGQYAAVDEILTGRQNLVLFGQLNHLSRRQAHVRADALLEQFVLTNAANMPASTFSGGMRRRLDLAASLIVSPSVLFVDEPTTGLDPAGRREVWSAIRSLVATGTTVLLTTQYLEEADQLAHRISMLKEGRVIAEGTPDALKARLGGDWLDIIVRPGVEIAAVA